MQMLSGNVMVVTTEVEPAWEDEYNRWQAEEYVPGMLRIGGFLSAERYVAVVGGPKYMTYFQMATSNLSHCLQAELAKGTARALAVGRHSQSDTAVYEQIFPKEGVVKGAEWGEGNTASGSVLLNRFNVLPQDDAEFNAWYNEEHLPMLAAVAGSISNRRFKAREGTRLYLARYDLASPDVPSTEAWRAIVATPWTQKMSKVWRDPWRTLFTPLGDQVIAG